MKIPPDSNHHKATPPKTRGVPREVLAASEAIQSSLRPLIDTFSKKATEYQKASKGASLKGRVSVRGPGGKKDGITNPSARTDTFAKRFFSGKATALSPQTVVRRT